VKFKSADNYAMIPDIPAKIVIITFVAAILVMPFGAFAETVADENTSSTGPVSPGMQEKTPMPAGPQSENPMIDVVVDNGTALSRINTYEPASVLMKFIPVNHIFFPHDKATLNQRSVKILDDTAHYILLSGKVDRVIIYGHANSIAGNEYNDRLADKRANAVKDYLIKKKIPAELMQVTGWGENAPADENWTHPGSQRNRRVEIYLVQHGS
jgi:outer membrane protein OmpA-like peptidoglycan-associated protein